MFPVDGQLVDQKAAAAQVGVCVRTIRNWVDRGILTGYRAGPRLLRVNLNEVLSLVKPVGRAEL